MKSIRIATVLTVAALVLGAPTAGADDLPVGMANAKNLIERTVTIDDQTYRVTGSTRIVSRDGRPMRLVDVVTEADLGDMVDLDRVSYAYDAHGDVLARLQAVPARR